MPAENELLIGDEPDAVPRARHFLTSILDSAGITDAAETAQDAKLVVTELVTNALLHARPPVAVRVALLDPGVRIEVADPFRLSPVRPRDNPEAMTGRGIALIEALSQRWGVEPATEGKVIWAELGLSRSEDSEAPEGGLEDVDVDAVLASWTDDYDDDEPRFSIRLGDVPTDLLLSAKTHVNNVVREFVLAEAGAATGAAGTVPIDLTHLISSVVHNFAEARQEIKRQALAAAAAGKERTDLALTLPASAADAGEAYLAALDQVDSYARAARLLTLESLPQHRAFRRWYVESLVTQLRRAARGEPPGERQTLEQRLLAEYAAVAAAHRAADRAARLQNVTAALAAASTSAEVALAVVSEGVTMLGAGGGALLVREQDGSLSAAAAVGYSPDLVRVLCRREQEADLPSAYALHTGEPVWLESPSGRDDRFPRLAAVEPGAAALCAVPVRPAHHAKGVLRFSFDLPRLFDEDERRFVSALAVQGAQALDRSYLYAAERSARASAERLAAWLARLQRVTSELTAARDTERVADIIVTHLADGRPGCPAGIGLSAGEPGTLRIVRSGNVDSDLARRWHTHPVSARVPTGKVVRRMPRCWSTDGRTTCVASRTTHRTRSRPVTSWSCPSRSGNGCSAPWSGVFPRGSHEATELPFLVTLAETCAQSVARAEALGTAEAATGKLTFLADARRCSPAVSHPDEISPISLAGRASARRLVRHPGAGGRRSQDARRGPRRPGEDALGLAIQERYPTTMDQPTGVPEVIRTGRSGLPGDHR